MKGMTPGNNWPALALLALLVAGCTSCGGGNSANPPPPPPPVDRPAFDRDRAFGDLEAQVAFGPRIPGSQAHTDTLNWLVSTLTPLADQVGRQDFSSSTPFGGPYDFSNVIALFGKDKPGEVWLVGAHWDCRPKADADPDPANRNSPVPGANDGASGVAVLLEMARALKQQAPTHPIMLAFFDAEDSGKSGSSLPYMGFCLGSRQMADHWPSQFPEPAQVIVLDLVGQDNLHNMRLGTPNGSNDRFDLPKEPNSVSADAALVNRVWSAAQRLGNTAFEQRSGPAMTDDHLPFISAGHPAIDIIDFPPPEWHTVDDTPANCSADALFQVGDTVLEVLYGG